MLSAGNLFAMINYNDRKILETKKYILSSVLPVYLLVPLYHVAGLNIPFAFGYSGESVDLSSGIKNIYKDIEMYGSAYTMTPPVVLNDFYKELTRGNRDKLGNLRVIICGGAAFDHEFLDAFEASGIHILTAYGMSETNGIGCMSHLFENDSNRKLHSVGTFDEESTICIIDDEICFKGGTVTKGYYNNKAATDEAIDSEGWFHSGDLGYLDDEGYLFLTGRKKNLIILDSGENVIPEELEALLAENELIKECIVKERDKKVCAEIYCDNEAQDEVRSFVRDVNRKLVPYKRMTLVVFRETPFERTSLGKIKRV